MAQAPRYSDAQLAEAISEASSWRGVLRELDIPQSSSSAARSARMRADALSLSYKHFQRQRSWTEARLRTAVATSRSWGEVAEVLGLRGSASAASLQGHAARLRIEAAHLESDVSGGATDSLSPGLVHLNRAGPLLAAAWFTLCGWDVSWPLEPSRFDLIVTRGDHVRKVQVKTTVARAGSTWKAYLSTARKSRKTYVPGEIDDFFIVTGALDCYLIPLVEVGGLHAIHLSQYRRFRVQNVPSPVSEQSGLVSV